MLKKGIPGRGSKCKHGISQVAPVVKNKFANAGDMRHGFDTYVGKICLREGMTMNTHSSILAWIIQWTEEPRTHTCKLACPKILKYIYMDRRKGMGGGGRIKINVVRKP